jgi:hypothetical protein
VPAQLCTAVHTLCCCMPERLLCVHNQQNLPMCTNLRQRTCNNLSQHPQNVPAMPPAVPCAPAGAPAPACTCLSRHSSLQLQLVAWRLPKLPVAQSGNTISAVNSFNQLYNQSSARQSQKVPAMPPAVPCAPAGAPACCCPDSMPVTPPDSPVSGPPRRAM